METLVTFDGYEARKPEAPSIKFQILNKCRISMTKIQLPEKIMKHWLRSAVSKSETASGVVCRQRLLYAKDDARNATAVLSLRATAGSVAILVIEQE